jgi:hypothetical protein
LNYLWMKGARRAALMLGVGSLAAACTPLDDPSDVYDNDTAEVVQQLPGSGQPLDETRRTEGDPWACLQGSRVPLPPREERPEAVTYTVSIVDWVTDEAPPGLVINVCNRIDPLCAEPLSTIEPPPERQISFQLPARIEVFLLLQATDTVPAAFYFDGPVVEDRLGGLIQLLRFATVASLAQTFLGTMLDPSMGALSLRSHDCSGAIAEGAVFELEPQNGVPFTLIDGAPTPSIVPTDTSGLAGFVNVPPGSFLARGMVADDDREFGLANFNIQAAQFSLVEVRSN